MNTMHPIWCKRQTKQGDRYINGSKFPTAELQDRLRELHEEGTDRRLVIRMTRKPGLECDYVVYGNGKSAYDELQFQVQFHVNGKRTTTRWLCRGENNVERNILAEDVYDPSAMDICYG